MERGLSKEDSHQNSTATFAAYHIQTVLKHHGIKGMRWGVRKGRESSSSTTSIAPHGITFKSDGSIVIKRGASLQRLVRSNGKSLPMKDITYASLNAYDNARYIKVIGGKGFFGGGRDTILAIHATRSIKAPSISDATKIVSNKMLSDAQFRKKNTDLLGRPISDKELEAIRKDPTGKVAKSWYFHTNQKMTFDKEFDSDAPYIQKAIREEMARHGFNALRDENDVSSGIAKSPIIVFDPQHSLRVVSTTQITDELRKANKEILKRYKTNGKTWVDKQLYG